MCKCNFWWVMLEELWVCLVLKEKGICEEFVYFVVCGEWSNVLVYNVSCE